MKLGSMFFRFGIFEWSRGWISFASVIRLTNSFEGTMTSKPGLPAFSLANSSSLVANRLMFTSTPLAALKSARVVSPM